VLHNFILKNEEKLTGKKTYVRIGLEGVHENHSGVSTMSVYRGRSNNNSISIREAYSTYFQGHGALSYQWEKAIQNDF